MPSTSDTRLTESSSAAYSKLTPNLYYTNNDEGTTPHVYAIDVTTGNTVFTFNWGGTTKIKDPEAICVDALGRIWYADIGDNPTSSRSYVSLYMRGEPTPGTGHLGGLDYSRFDLTYPDGARNAESFLINPVTNERYIISKEATGHLYKLPENLQVYDGHTVRTNGLTLVNSSMPANVSDACFTPDGRFVFLRRASQNTSVFVIEPAVSWTTVIDTLTVTSQTKPEGIGIAWDQMSYLITSEGKNAPFYTPAMPPAYLAMPPGPSPSNPCG